MDSNSSSVTGVPLLFPESVIPSKFSNRAIVTDVLIPKGTTFGPYPGHDAVEKKCNNWMQYVTSVTDHWEANMVVAILKKQLYFRCNRNIRAGTELIVWGGQKKIHLQDPSEWTKYKIDETILTFLCQDCDLNFKTVNMLVLHNNNSHLAQKLPQKYSKCPHCPFIGYRMDLRKHLVRHGIDLYGKPLAINQNKAPTEIENAKTGPKFQSDFNSDSESDFQFESNPEADSQSEANWKSNFTKIPTARNEAIAEEYEYSCKLCKKTFNRPQQIYGHIGSVHKMTKSTYGEVIPIRKLRSDGDCDTSKHSIVKNKGPKEHTIINYICNYCEGVFLSSRSRNRHINSVHLGIRFACSVCRSEYTTKCALNKHMKSSHNL